MLSVKVTYLNSFQYCPILKDYLFLSKEKYKKVNWKTVVYSVQSTVYSVQCK